MTLTVLNTTEDALTAFDPLKRDCYTETEFYFKYMNWADGFRYSMQNCLYESVLEHIIDHCKCVPAFANFKLNIEPMPTVCRGKDLTCAKGGLISEKFSLWLKSPKKGDKSRS